MALQAVRDLNKLGHIAIFTDSENWARILNLSSVASELGGLADEAFNLIGHICATSHIQAFDVESHAGYFYNELADKLCTAMHGDIDVDFFDRSGLKE
eukprot:1162631-Karenia_brevis.AAC.1